MRQGGKRSRPRDMQELPVLLCLDLLLAQLRRNVTPLRSANPNAAGPAVGNGGAPHLRRRSLRGQLVRHAHPHRLNVRRWEKLQLQVPASLTLSRSHSSDD
jgi:hypothetical protein